MTFTYPKRISHVLIINTEDAACTSGGGSCTDLIKEADLRVGYDPDPALNVACKAGLADSGIFSCGGKVGTYLSIHKASASELSICEIRAQTHPFNTGSVKWGRESASNKIIGGLFDLKSFKLSSTSPTYTNTAGGTTGANSIFIRFPEIRRVHSVTLLGSKDNNWTNSLGWYLCLNLDIDSRCKDRDSRIYPPSS